MRGFIAAVACLIVGFVLGTIVTCTPEPIETTVIEVKVDTLWPDTVFQDVPMPYAVPGPSSTYTVYSKDSMSQDSFTA